MSWVASVSQSQRQPSSSRWDSIRCFPTFPTSESNSTSRVVILLRPTVDDMPPVPREARGRVPLDSSFDAARTFGPSVRPEADRRAGEAPSGASVR